MKKFIYDKNDTKILEKDGEKLIFYRIIANRDIKNPYAKISKGEKGGYIIEGTLSQEGESWVDKTSVVGNHCYICGDAYIADSKLTKNVRVGNSAAVSQSRINAEKDCSVYGNAAVICSEIDGNINLSGDALMDTCRVMSGYISMTDNSHLERSTVYGQKDGIAMVNDNNIRDSFISGHGPVFSDFVKIQSFLTDIVFDPEKEC